MELVKMTLPFDPRTKKNGSRIITRGGYPRLIPSAQYEKWRSECIAYIKANYTECITAINEPVNIKAVYYMQTRRRVDITNLHSAISDMLVDAEVLADDNRDICAAYDGSRVYHDKNNPRCEIMISTLDEDYTIWRSKK